jgi:diaminopimelate decarboxylase
MTPPRVLAAVAALDRPVCAYLYDRATLSRRGAELSSALPPGTLVLYAVKANGDPEVVRTVSSTVDGLEVASGGELDLAADAAIVAFSGPAKTDAELASALRAGALINVESALELRRLALAAAGAVTPARVLLRVNRLGGTPTGTHRMTGVPSQFGIDEAQLEEVAALASRLRGIRIVGFHLHAVSNNLDATEHAAYIVEAVRWSVRTAARLSSVDLEYVNVGGGFGIDYVGHARFDLDALSDGLADVPLLLGDARLIVEPGRYLAAEAGWYAAQVLDLKRTHGRWYAVLRGGTHHFRLPAAWGYSHPFQVVSVEHWPYPFARPEVRDVPVDVVGELCTPRDVLARDAPVSRLRVGDVLLFGKAGAYGWEVSHHDFLRHPYPQIVML